MGCGASTAAGAAMGPAPRAGEDYQSRQLSRGEAERLREANGGELPWERAAAAAGGGGGGRCVIIEAPAAPGSEARDPRDADGHRPDTVPICRAFAEVGWSCEPVFYTDEAAEEVQAAVEAADAALYRVTPGGQYRGVTMSKLEELMRGCVERGHVVAPHPDAAGVMAAPDALARVRDLSCGFAGTQAYASFADFAEHFPRQLESGDARVIRLRGGRENEGGGGGGGGATPRPPPWAVRLAGGDAGPSGPDALVEVTSLAEGADMEEKTLREFVAPFEGLVDAPPGSQPPVLLDQPFSPAHGEGRLSVQLIYDNPVEIVHVRYSADSGGSRSFRSHPPNAAQFEGVLDRLHADLPRLMAALGLEGAALPPIWAVDLARADAAGGPADADYRYSAFHCGRVGLQNRLHLSLHVAHAVLKLCKRAIPPPRAEGAL